MSNPADLTLFRQAIMQQLANDLGISFIAGKLPGPVQGSDLGCCWIEQVAEVPGRIEEEQVIVVARVFRQFEQVVDVETPYDPAPLETLVAALQGSVKAHQTGIAGAWFQRIVRIQLDMETQGVEAQILATRANSGIV